MERERLNERERETAREEEKGKEEIASLIDGGAIFLMTLLGSLFS